MPNFSEDPTSRFLQYYEQYLTAKQEKKPQMVGLALWAEEENFRNGRSRQGSKILPKDFRAIRAQETGRVNIS
jgi:hypothetical protein